MAEVSAREPAEDIDALLGLGSASGTGLLARWKKPVIIGGLVAAALVVAVLFYWGRSVDATGYATAPVTRGDLEVIVTATGSVQPTNQVDCSPAFSAPSRRSAFWSAASAS
jgi:HlyD family secretion protein